MRVLTLFFLTCVAASANAGSPMCGVAPVGVFKAGFEVGEVAPAPYNPSPTLPGDATPLTLTVTYPSDGITVGTSSIQVHGTFSGPPNTGVSVNDMAALQSATSFLSRSVALEPGANQVAIRATGATGATQSIVRTVTYSPAMAPDVELKSAHVGDYSPFSLRFTVALRPGIANPNIERIRIDFNSDSTFDLDTTDPTERLTYRFQSPGPYLATAEVTLAGAPPVTVLHRVMAENLDVTRASLCKTFERFRSALAAQQYTSALQVFNADVRPDYQSFIEGLGTNGAEAASRLGAIVDGAIGLDSAEMILARPIPGEPGRFRSYPLQFSRDSDGVWRISAL